VSLGKNFTKHIFRILRLACFRVVGCDKCIGGEGQTPGGVVPGVKLQGLFVLQGWHDQGKHHGEADKCSGKQNLKIKIKKIFEPKNRVCLKI
jgi:hypothetical protein